MSAKVKNQHYIPQMYLNLFSTNDNRLCVWNLSTDQVLDNQSSRNFASSKYFYDTNSEDLKELISEIASVRPKLLEKVDLEDEQFVEKELGRMEGDVAGAAKIQIDAIPLINALFCEVNPIPVKTALNLMGMNVGPLRMPLCEMEESNKETLIKAMKDFGIKLA